MNNLQDIWEIYEDSFPEDEKRSIKDQRKLLDNPLYKIVPYKSKDMTVGFSAVWEFESFLYVEHAATSAKLRGRGYGSKMYKDLMKKYQTKIVLEVEPPEDDLSRRRIEFYQRLDFKLNHYEYKQPAYDASKKEVPLMIMSYPQKLIPDEFNEVKNVIYENVFGINNK